MRVATAAALAESAPELLHLGEADVELDLALRRQVLRDVRLDAPKHERPQHRVELLDDVVLRVVALVE